MWKSRAVVLACVASLCGKTPVQADVVRPDRANWKDSQPIDLYPLLETRLRQQVTVNLDEQAPEPMTGDSRAMAYPMVPAPPAGESGIAFGGLIVGYLSWRFWRYGRFTGRFLAR